MQHDIKNLKKLIYFCRKNGILRYKSGSFEIELSNKVIPDEVKRRTEIPAEESPPGFPSWESLSDEQKLLWSATPTPIEQKI
jgi:hypothetical protein